MLKRRRHSPPDHLPQFAARWRKARLTIGAGAAVFCLAQTTLGQTPKTEPAEGQTQDLEVTQVQPGQLAQPSQAPEPVQPVQVVPSPVNTPSCFPSCRAGFMCNASGQCVSACNPPCGDGSVCTAELTCVETAAGRASSNGPVKGDAGWARGAGYVGIATGISALGLAVAAAANNEDQDTAIALGSIGTALFGIGVPVTASGGASARQDPRVTGVGGARIAGWLGYGLALADAIVLIGIGLSDAEVPAEVIVSVGLLGAASATAFAIDAFASASQFEQLSDSAPTTHELRLAPVVGAVPDATGGVNAYVGVAGSFL